MRRQIFILLLIILFFSCKTQENINSGIFRHTIRYSQNSGYITEQLILRSDSTFVLNTYGSSPHYATCVGRWKYIAKDTIMIHCIGNEGFDFSNPNKIIFRPVRKIKVLTPNKVKILQTYGTTDKYIKLKRVKLVYSEENWKHDRYNE